MTVLNFANIQKELTDFDLKNPVIKLHPNTIKFISQPFFDDILSTLFLLAISCIGFFSSIFLIPSIIIFLAALYFSYLHFIGMNIVKIDFLNKKLVITNRVFIFNLIRNIFKIKTDINFSDIREICHTEGERLSRFTIISQSRYLLLVETYSDPTITTLQFKKEQDAKKVVDIFNKFLTKKENIIA